MTDLVSQLVGALELCQRALQSQWSPYLRAGDKEAAAMKAAASALSAAKAGGQPPRVLGTSQPAAVSDEAIYAVWAQHCQTPGTTTRQLVCGFARAILALRPQAEPAQPRTFDDRNAKFREENWQIRFDAAVEARRAAQERLYTERERHTAEVKRLQAEIGRLQSLRPQAVPMTEWLAEAVAAEREACAAVVDGQYRVLEARRAHAEGCLGGANYAYFVPTMEAIAECATAIRSRGIAAPAGGGGGLHREGPSARSAQRQHHERLLVARAGSLR